MNTVQFAKPMPVTNSSCCSDSRVQCAKCAEAALSASLNYERIDAMLTNDDPAVRSTPPLRMPNDDLPSPLDGSAYLLSDQSIAVEYDSPEVSVRDIKTFKSLDSAREFYRQMLSAGKNPSAQKLVAATAAVEQAKRKIPRVAGNSAGDDRSPQVGVPVWNFENPLEQQPAEQPNDSETRVVRNGVGDGSLLGIPEMEFANPVD